MLTQNKFQVIKPGIQTSIQDLGRRGYMAYGVGRSGAMDQSSARKANWLVGNDEHAALLETVHHGLHIKFYSNCQVAITGADLGAQMNGEEIERYRTQMVQAGDELSFTRRKSGLRAYLAVSGGILSTKVMGSRSFHSMVDLGIKAVIDGIELEFGDQEKKLVSREIKKKKHPVFANHYTARVLPGPEYNFFDTEFIKEFEKYSFKVSPDSNRMGYRLDRLSSQIELKDGIISSGIYPGTIQIPSSGQPIILMSDGPTTGGYPRIGNVLSQDLDFIAQLGPGDSLRFRWILLEEVGD